jgi:hypothetical protein
MSFGIRPTFKQRMVVTNDNDQADTKIIDSDEARRIIETIQQHTQRSNHNQITYQQLQNVIRDSSINPDINPAMREIVDKMLSDRVNKDANLNNAVQNVVNNMYGFSNASTTSFANNTFKQLMDIELNNNLANLAVDEKGDASAPVDEEETAEEKEEKQQRKDETDEEHQKRLEVIRNRKLVSIGYPKTASMLRGWVNRQTGTSGGIRKTPHGMVDAF